MIDSNVEINQVMKEYVMKYILFGLIAGLLITVVGSLVHTNQDNVNLSGFYIEQSALQK